MGAVGLAGPAPGGRVTGARTISSVGERVGGPGPGELDLDAVELRGPRKEASAIVAASSSLLSSSIR